MTVFSIPRKKSGKSVENTIWIAIPLFAISLGIILRIFIRTSTSLWEDEIIAVTHATQPLLGVIVDLLANDMHPPLYFLELHFWSLINHSDAWLIANSVVFGLAAIGSIFLVARKFSNTSRALVITAIFSVLPVPIWMAGEVRMYSLMSVLLIWVYYFIHKIFAFGERCTKQNIALILLATAIMYTHAIGFVAIFFFGIYAGSWLIARRSASREWILWIVIFGLSAIAALPLIAKDFLTPADMPPLKSISGLLGWLASIVIGGGYRANAWLMPAGLVIWLAVAGFGCIAPRTRRLTICFLIAPIFLCLIAELVLRPLFKTDFFSNFCAPFLAIAIGDLLLALPAKKAVRSIVLLCALAALLFLAITNREIMNAANGYYRKTADIISTEKKPGDVVWAPQTDIFWGMAWYLAGAGWGSPTEINAPWRAQSGWWKLVDFIGRDRAERLHLIPHKQTIVAKDGLPIIVAPSSRARVEQARRVWLVTYAPRNDVPPDLPSNALGPLRRTRSFSFPPIQLNLYELPEDKPQ